MCSKLPTSVCAVTRIGKARLRQGGETWGKPISADPSNPNGGPISQLVTGLSKETRHQSFWHGSFKRWNINHLGTGVSRRWDTSPLGIGVSRRWDICHLGMVVSEGPEDEREQNQGWPLPRKHCHSRLHLIIRTASTDAPVQKLNDWDLANWSIEQSNGTESLLLSDWSRKKLRTTEERT